MSVNLNCFKYTHWQSNITVWAVGVLVHLSRRESLVTRKRECYRAVTWVQKVHVMYLFFCFVFLTDSEMYWHITREKRLREHTRDLSNLTPFSPPALYFTLVVWTGRSAQVTQSRSSCVTPLSVWPSDVSRTPLVAWRRRLVFTMWMEIVYGDRWRQKTSSQQLWVISRRVNAQLLRETERMISVRERVTDKSRDRYEDRQRQWMMAVVWERKDETYSIVLMFTLTLPAHLLVLLFQISHFTTHTQSDIQLSSYTLQLPKYDK